MQKHKQMLSELADDLEAIEFMQGLAFDMQAFQLIADVEKHSSEDKRFPLCGMAGCIGGWVCAKFGTETYDNGRPRISESYAYQLLGIEDEGGYDVVHDLFYPPENSKTFGVHWDWIERKHAAQAIRNYVEFDDPMWNAIWQQYREEKRAAADQS